MAATKSPSAKPIRTVKKTEKREALKNTKSEGRYFSRAVSKALEVLELLQGEQVSMTLNDISRRVHVSKTSTFRLLRTLETAGCLADIGGGRFHLTPGVHSVVPTQSLARLLRAATPRLVELSRELRETASLAALFDNRVEAIAVNESPQTIRMSNVVGHIVPPNASSLGKAITAFQSEERREKLLRSFGIYRFTDHTITDRTQLDREFEQVRLQGFAADREESVGDGNCYAVPIFGDSGEVAAAISVSLPKVRVRGAEHEEAIIAALRTAAEQIATDLRTA